MAGILRAGSPGREMGEVAGQVAVSGPSSSVRRKDAARGYGEGGGVGDLFEEA